MNGAILTVETLEDIVQSQIVLYGNRRLFIRNKGEHAKSFSLLAGECSVAPFFDCTGKYEADMGEHSLFVLAERLKSLNVEDEIFCSDDEVVIRGFQLGFTDEDEGFIETINSSEVVQPTLV
ncbi:hypothetical protein KUL42_39270 [Alteromonas sp. KUL42]|nr:hypothetical protein [Alteromonas sp. KUL42]GEA09166.1 hypothetical protein KUL42_39270 [Alteromonas sp. KUL42]